MQKKKHRILFVSHMANWSGAPLILLGIIKKFSDHSNIPFRILIMEDGDLSGQFRSAGRTFVWRKKTKKRSSFAMFFISPFARMVQIARAVYILYCVRDTSFVFFNTIANGHIHKKLLSPGRKYVCYVHEMAAAIHILTSSNSLDTVLNHTDFFFAGSEAVKKNLVDSFNIKPSRVQVIYSSIAEVSRQKKDHSKFTASFKEQHNIPDDATIIGVSAASEWRKGFDLFFPLTAVYFNLFPESNVYFLWKGFRENRNTFFQDAFDYKKYNTNNRIRLIPHGDDAIDCMAMFDIHLLLSREDPYPVVVLEAASFGIPTVCFADAGGSPEFIEKDCGYCVPYGDLVEMARRLHELSENTALRNEMSLAAREKVKARHTQDKAALDISHAIDNLLNSDETKSLQLNFKV